LGAILAAGTCHDLNSDLITSHVRKRGGHDGCIEHFRPEAGHAGRRHFAVSAASKTAFADDFGYVDAHSHLWSIDRVDYPLAPGAKEEDVQPKSFDVGEFFEVARPEGVTRVVGIGHGPHFGTDARYLVDVMKARPGQVAVQAQLDLNADPAKQMAELKARIPFIKELIRRGR